MYSQFMMNGQKNINSVVLLANLSKWERCFYFSLPHDTVLYTLQQFK